MSHRFRAIKPVSSADKLFYSSPACQDIALFRNFSWVK